MSTCVASLNVEAIRVAKLSTAGAPDTGANKGYISDAQIKVEIGLELETGTEFTQKNGAGAICATAKEADKIKRATVTLDLCRFDFALMGLMCDGSVFSASSNAIGYQPPAVEAGDPDPICFEVWTKAWEGAAQAVPAFTSPNAAYLHYVLPFVRFTQQPFTLENGFTVFQVRGDGSENDSITANGPWNDWPSAIASAGGVTRTFGVFFDDDLPTAACAYQTVPSGS